jgi:N-methylhydantoinase A
VRVFAGVDVGGTFTDVVVATDDGRTVVRKLLTTHDDPRLAVVDGLQSALDDAGLAAADVVRVVHGTTLATNVILERQGGRIAFVTTEGFGDLLRLGREARVEEDRFDLFFQTPRPPVEHEATFEVSERVTAHGDVLVPLDPDHARSVAERIAAIEPDGVAICFLHSYAVPAHEELMATACQEVLGEAFVVTSSEVWPEQREYERAMTTVMCAYVGPVMASYLAGLGERLASIGVGCGVEVMESSGSVMSAALAARRPVYTVESGGAAGVTAAGAVGRLVGITELISFDMGGTTAKTAVVRDGRPTVVHDLQIGGKGSFGGARAGTGFPVKVPVVDMAEVGAGGGSIAWIDGGGGLRVGPRSSGSVPGPACYGRGGDAPTVTDANLVLGYVNPAGLAGGVSLSLERAEEVLQREIASPLGLDLTGAARAVHDLANASMASAIRVVTVQRGVDPRGFTLVAFGGAGPTHAAGLAGTFDITSITVPWSAGVASAIGLVSADLGVERVRTWIGDIDGIEPAQLEAVFAELEAACRDELGGGGIVVHRAVDARFLGQAHQLIVPVADVADVAAAFRKEHSRAYGVDADGPVELVNVRVRATRLAEKPAGRPLPVVAGADPSPARRGERRAHLGGAFGAVPVYAWEALPPGAAIEGPVLIDAADTTVVVPPEWRAEVDGWRNVLLNLEGTHE